MSVYHLRFLWTTFLIVIFVAQNAAQTRTQDSLILVDIRELLEMDSFDNPSLIWDLSEPIDNWFGVTLSENGRVTRLTLFNRSEPRRDVFLSPRIIGLDNLVYLHVGFTNGYSSINTSLVNFPSLFRLPLENLWLYPVLPNQLDSLHLLSESIKYLRVENSLSSPIVSIPESVYDLSYLINLSINSNFSGQLDERIGRLTKLDDLSISLTAMDGFLPEAFGSMTHIRQIHLESNRNMEGIIPDVFHNQTSIRRIQGTYIGLRGTIPASLYRNPHIESVIFNRNELTDTLAHDWSPSITSIALASNQLYGKIPDGFLNNRGWVSLRGNDLIGELPEMIVTDSLVVLPRISVSRNELTGGIPKIYFSRVGDLYVDGNNLTEPLDYDPPILMERLFCESNFFTFEDLVDVVQEFDNIGSRIGYAPQKTAGVLDTFEYRVGCPVEMELIFDDTVSTSIYYWFKDGVSFDTVYGTNELKIDEMSLALEGDYHAEIVNHLAPDLRLETYPLTLRVEECTREDQRIDTLVCPGIPVVFYDKTYEEEGVYEDTVLIDCCEQYIRIELHHQELPSDWRVNDEFTSCQDSSVILYWNSTQDVEGITVKWTSLEGEIIGDDDLWIPMVRGAGTYQVEVMDSLKCSYQYEIELSNYSKLTWHSSEEQHECASSYFDLDWLQSSADELYNTRWYNQEGEEISTSLQPQVNESGTYYVIFEDEYGCGYEDSLKLSLYPELEYRTRELFSVCEDSIIRLDWLLDSVTMTEINWTNHRGRIIEGIGALIPMVQGAGEYWVSYRDENQCLRKDTVLVQTYSTEEYSIVQSPELAYIGDRVEVEIEAEVLEILWSLSGIECRDCRPLEIEIMDSIYYLTTVVTDNNGCRTIVNDTLRYLDRPGTDIVYPNVITPNEDGVNDYLCIQGTPEQLSSFREFVVMDRMGTVKYKKEQFQNCEWSGEDQLGKALPAGTYYYRIGIWNSRPILSSLLIK